MSLEHILFITLVFVMTSDYLLLSSLYLHLVLGKITIINSCIASV
jgi:hypothetical protein